jgi:hypothetical protein
MAASKRAIAQSRWRGSVWQPAQCVRSRSGRSCSAAVNSCTNCCVSCSGCGARETSAASDLTPRQFPACGFAVPSRPLTSSPQNQHHLVRSPGPASGAHLKQGECFFDRANDREWCRHARVQLRVGEAALLRGLDLEHRPPPAMKQQQIRQASPLIGNTCTPTLRSAWMIRRSVPSLRAFCRWRLIANCLHARFGAPCFCRCRSEQQPRPSRRGRSSCVGCGVLESLPPAPPRASPCRSARPSRCGLSRRDPPCYQRRCLHRWQTIKPGGIAHTSARRRNDARDDSRRCCTSRSRSGK